ncbi:MAG TPA: flagellar biosynthetic protein FliR [bacterium]|jgi:flagellar biosynthetic protein FliR
MPIDIHQIEFFVLVFIRIAGALAVLPLFSHSAIPAMLKAGLAGAIALLLVPTLSGSMPAPSGTILDFFMLAFRETVCGMLIGFAGQFLFYAVDIAGQLIGFQAGFSVVSSIDPNTEAQSTVITQMYNLTAMLVFLAINGHHAMLKAVCDSFHVIPIGKLTVDSRLFDWTMLSIKDVMVDGIRLAAPLMVTLLLTDVGLGILTRVAPTLNVFVIGFPLKIAITLMMVSMTLGVVVSIFTTQFGDYVHQAPAFLKLLTGP